MLLWHLVLRLNTRLGGFAWIKWLKTKARRPRTLSFRSLDSLMNRLRMLAFLRKGVSTLSLLQWSSKNSRNNQGLVLSWFLRLIEWKSLENGLSNCCSCWVNCWKSSNFHWDYINYLSLGWLVNLDFNPPFHALLWCLTLRCA